MHNSEYIYNMYLKLQKPLCMFRQVIVIIKGFQSKVHEVFTATDVLKITH
jgi:hypothetical protein